MEPWQGGGGSGLSPFVFRHAGTSPFEIWYPSLIHSASASTQAPAIDTLFATPFVGRGGSLDRIQFEVTSGAAGGVGRVGIYNITSRSSYYPTSLVVDGGEFSLVAGGVKAATISTPLAAGQLYWAVYLQGVSAVLSVRASASPGGHYAQYMGIPAAMGTGGVAGISVAQAYGVLPTTFPAAAAIFAGNMPLIAMRYAS